MRVAAPSAPTYEPDGISSALDYAIMHRALEPLPPRALYHVPSHPIAP